MICISVSAIGLLLLVSSPFACQEHRLSQMTAAVEPGMTASQVVAAIGEPGCVYGLDQREWWYGHGTFDPTVEVTGTDHVMVYLVLAKALTVHVDVRGKVLAAAVSCR